MAIDDLLTEFESTLEQESALLELADAWVERTSGEVVPGVVWGRDEYIRNLQQTALWQKGFDVEGIAEQIRRNINPQSQDLNFAIYFPTLSITLTSFLEDSDEVKYLPGSNPRVMLNILSSYKYDKTVGNGLFMRGFAGDCVAVHAAVKRGKYSEDFLLSSIDQELRKRWDEYQASRKLRPSVINSVEKTLEHFLNDSDEAKYSSDSHPKSLVNILESYTIFVDGTGDFTHNGDCNVVYFHIKKENYTEDFLLSSIDQELRKRWDEYRVSRKLPPSVVQLVEETLEHFLNDSEEIKYTPDSGPRTLKNVLFYYRFNLDGGHENFTHEALGDCAGVYRYIRLGVYSEGFLLSSLNLDLQKKWNEYRITRKLRPSIIHLIEDTLEHFLNELDEVKYLSNSHPRSLDNVLRNYVFNCTPVFSKMGSCYNVYGHLFKKTYSREFLLSQINTDLRRKWEEYQGTMADNPYHLK